MRPRTPNAATARSTSSPASADSHLARRSWRDGYMLLHRGGLEPHPTGAKLRRCSHSQDPREDPEAPSSPDDRHGNVNHIIDGRSSDSRWLKAQEAKGRPG